MSLFLNIYYMQKKIVIFLKKIIRVVFFLIFRFDYWHTSPYENRDYILYCLKKLNNKYILAVDFGCGTGDLLRNIYSKKKIFIDSDIRILFFAKFLNFFSVKNLFCEIRYIKSFRLNKFIKNSNLILMLNFLHNYNLKECKFFLNNAYCAIAPKGQLVFDIIEKNHSYKYNHDVKKIFNKSILKKSIISKKLRFGRRVIIINKN